MPTMRVLSPVLIAVMLLVSALPARAANVVMEEFMIPSDTAGIQLFVRNKHPRRQTSFAPEKIVLFVHGGVAPSEVVLDIPLGGISWMDYIAERGYDVYLVDVRGYGHSSRPVEMEQPPNLNPPVARTEAATRDFGSAVDFIKKRRNVPKIVLMAWSWGTTIAGAYTAAHNDNVAKLILYAPQWLKVPPDTQQGSSLGAYSTTSLAAFKAGALNGVPEEKKSTLIPNGWLDQYAAALFATDPKSSDTNPVLRGPSGHAADGGDYWRVGKPYYDPSKIAVPTMLVHAEWDTVLPAYMTLAYWKLLTSAPYKRWVEIGEGTHAVFREKNRMELFREVQLFLDDTYKPE